MEHLAYPIFRPIVRKGLVFPERSTRTPFRTLLGSENLVLSVVRICRSNSWVSEHTSFALLKTRQHLLREQVEGMWKDLVRKGWKQVPAVCGAVAEHRSKKYQSVLLGKGIRPLCKSLIPYPINSDDPEQEHWIIRSLTMNGSRTTVVRWSDEYHHSTH